MTTGVPAALAEPQGAEEAAGGLVRRFKAHSESRVHGSPPSLAAVHAARQVLELNAAQGEALRRRLAGNVRLFRRLPAGEVFSVKTLQETPCLALPVRNRG